MGSFDEMFQRLEAKLTAGFRCVKLKIGAIDFKKEIELIRHIRQTFTRDRVELRVDANGAFAPEEAMQRLETLAQYDIIPSNSLSDSINGRRWHACVLILRYR